MKFNIDPQLAQSLYETGMSRLKELKTKKALLAKENIHIPELDVMIERQKQEIVGCAYYAFGDDTNNWFIV